jgi:branched-chain amino acid transport system permease protein
MGEAKVSTTVEMLGSLQIVLVNLAIFFGQYVIVATALNFQYGNAGIPNMSNNISVATGAYVVSSLVLKICVWIAGYAGLTLRPDWVYDNPYNVTTITAFLRANPYLSLALFLMSIALALVIGSLLGWVIASLSGGLRSTLLMVFLFVISDAGRIIVANNPFIAGGTMGAFVPNFLSWYPGQNMLILALSTLIVGLVCYFTIRTMQNSPFGRLMRATRENEWTVLSTGKNVVEIRRKVMMFSSGMMAVTGVLIAFYYNFVQYQMFTRNDFTFWPWLMVIIGGSGNNAGALLGVIVGVGLIRGFSMFNMVFGDVIAATRQTALIGYLENMVLGALLLLVMAYKPRGLIPEKKHFISGIDYKGIISEELEEATGRRVGE